MTITAERETVMDFTDPYFEATQALMTKKGSGITSLEDLAGKTVAVQDATTGTDYVSENAPEDTKIISFEDSSLISRRSRPARPTRASTTTACSTTSSARTPTSRSHRVPDRREYGFSVKKGGNEELSTPSTRASRATSTTRIYKKWFGKAPRSDLTVPGRSRREGDLTWRVPASVPPGGATSSTPCSWSSLLGIALLADWEELQRAFFDWDVVKEQFPDVITIALKNTLIYTACGFAFGLALAWCSR